MITLLVKIFGYAEKLVLANYFGTSYQVDVYTIVLTIVLSLFFFFREIVEPGFLNVFLDARSKGNEPASWGLFNKGIRLIFGVTFVISLFSFLFPEILATIFAPGFMGEKLILTEKMIRIAIPACIFLALSTLTGITLNGLKIFVLPASGELAFKGMIIFCMVIFFESYGIIGAAIGVVVGSMSKLGVHLFKLFPKISFKRIAVETKYKRRIRQLTWPLLLGVGFSQASTLVDNIFASYLQEGAIAALSYAKKVVELPVILFPYVISIVIFPYFTQLTVEKQDQKLIELLGDSLKWILIAFLPISIFFILFSSSIIEIIFQRGAFDTRSTLLTTKPFIIYSFGLVFFAIETILVVFYYSKADTKTPVFVGMICVIINILLTWILIQFMGYTGIALSFVIQKVLKNITLLTLLKKKIHYNLNYVLNYLQKFILPVLIITVVLIIAYYLFQRLPDTNQIQRFIVLVLIFGIGSGIYLVILQKLGHVKFLSKPKR